MSREAVKRPTSGIVSAVGLLLFLVLPASASDKGYADFSIWNRSLLTRDPLLSRPNMTETVFHLEAAQNITNYGTISLWTDALYSGGNVRFSKISAGWTGFNFKGMILEARLGDGTFINSNLDKRFINQYHPYVYFRGISASVAAASFDLSVFGGRIARLSGLLGTSYEIKDQPFYGLKGRWKFGNGGIFGAGIAYTRPDPTDLPASGGAPAEKGTLVMLDAEAGLVKGASVLGEFRGRLGRAGGSSAAGSANALRFGPLFRSGKWDVEANYRFTGSRFQDLNQESLIVRDERGLFSSVRYQASRNLTLFGIADRYGNNTDHDPALNTSRVWSIIAGFHLNTRSLLNLTAQWEIQDRITERAGAENVGYTSKGVFVQASKSMGNFFPYLRIRLHGVRDGTDPSSRSFVPTVYAGFRTTTASRATLWVEGQFDQKSWSGEEVTERTLVLRTGWNQSISSKLDLYSELFYERYGRTNPISQVVAYLGLRIGVGRDTEVRLDLRANEPLNRRSTRPSDYQINLRVDKRFSWGLEPKVLGRQVMGGEAVGLGTLDGFVFEDKDGDGLLGPGEKGISGLSLRLEDGSKTTTGSDGRYRFANVAEGPHQIKIEETRIPANFYLLSRGRVDVLIQARQISQVHFLLISGSNFSGRFLDDTNRNGKADPEDKGLADINVILTPVNKAGAEKKPGLEEAGLVLNTYTDASGGFRFVNILPGEYELSVDPDTVPQGAAVTVALPFKIKLEPGQNSVGNDFLVAPRPVIRKK